MVIVIFNCELNSTAAYLCMHTALLIKRKGTLKSKWDFNSAGRELKQINAFKLM